MKMRKSGCTAVSIGVESANDELLKRMKKRATVAQIREGCENLHKAGINITAQFMIGNPGDTLESVMETIEFAREMKFANVAFYLALPYPKTELWDYAVEHGTFLQRDYTQFHHFEKTPVFYTPEFSADERMACYRVARKLTLQCKLRTEMKTKLARIRRLDFKDMSVKRVYKAVERMGKFFLDLSLTRQEKV